MSPYLRTVKTASGATAVQVVHGSYRGSRNIEHIGSARSEAELAALKRAARGRVNAGQLELDLDLAGEQSVAGPLPITSSRCAHLLEAIAATYRWLGFDAVTGADDVFEMLVAARIIEPTSKLDSLRVLAEVGVAAPSYATVKRRLPVYATDGFMAGLSKAVAARAKISKASLLLYDVTTLYFETDEGDGFREPGFSKERRLEPQITVGLLTDVSGLPLMIDAFEGNRAETRTMIPVIDSFRAAYDLPDVTIVADAGMVSEANRKAIEKAGLSFILGMKVPEVPYVVADWRSKHPGREIPDGHIFVQPWPASPKDDRGDQVIYYQYREGRARRSLRGIDEQVKKAEQAMAGKTAIKRNRFVKLTGGKRAVNRDLEAKARALAGIKGYITTLTEPAEFVIASYHELWNIEASFRMSKHDLRARPIYHRLKDSIDAHLHIVFGALTISRRIEAETGWSIKKFVRTARRYRTIEVRAGSQTITAADPLPPELAAALEEISHATAAH